MTVTVSWDDMDKSILLYQFENPWTWDDLYAAVDVAREHLDSGVEPVDIIVDMERGKAIPSNAMAQFSKLSSVSHPRMRLRVIVGGGGMAASLLSVFIKVYRKGSQQYHVVNTREQAYTLIHEKREV